MGSAAPQSIVDHGRQKFVEGQLAPFARRPAIRRVPPPDGRLGADDYPIERLRSTLQALGPVFASFGRYLGTRPDLLPRRYCRELALITDVGRAAEPAAVDAHVYRQLGAPPARRYFQYDPRAYDVTLWTERHDAWVAPGVPAVVTVVRPDAAEWLERDLPLLAQLQSCVAVEPGDLAAAIADFSRTLRLRLDQTVQASALAALAADARSVGGFEAPVCYRDHCAPGVLTLERREEPSVAQLIARGPEAIDRPALARRIAAAWLQQARAGNAVPFEWSWSDLLVADRQLILTAAAFEPHGTAERTRFSRYIDAVAADDPDTAAAWILEPAAAPEMSAAAEEDLKRRFRQVVPFRDGEWSGEERLAEYVLVQWRASFEAGWRLTPHHLHLYRGLGAVDAVAERLAPADDALLGALDDARLRFGMSEASDLLDPRTVVARLDVALQEMVALPRKLDEVLTLAAEGRLRVRLRVPEGGGARTVKHQTISLVAILAVLIALASLLQRWTPAYGPAVERIGLAALLLIGGWLLVAAAKV